MIESLHNHTTTSDGRLSHREIFDLANQLGVGVFAFTDHDAVIPEEELAWLEGESARGRLTKWVSGIEITAAVPADVKGVSAGSVHVIGLFVDPRNSELRAHCTKAQEARVERMEYIVRELNARGFTITEEDCNHESGGDAVGRPHIVRALGKYPHNDGVIEKLRSDMEQAAAHDEEIKKKYDMMMQRGSADYPYVLFLSQDAFKPAYKEASYAPDIDEAVRLIRHAGGMAFIAHYSYEKKKLPLESLEILLRDNRVDGAEVIYGFGARGTTDEAVFENDKRWIRTMCARYGRFVSGGADAHEAEQLVSYAKSVDGRDSKGLCAEIIKSGAVEVRHSSLG
jgi:predicted metal-dependent phosphoesterase TrpH